MLHETMLVTDLIMTNHLVLIMTNHLVTDLIMTNHLSSYSATVFDTTSCRLFLARMLT